MGAVVLRLRSEARARWRTWVVLALLAGLAGGAVIAALAGARRTETAYARFLRSTAAFDVLVVNGGTTAENTNRQFNLDEVARLPEVADIALVRNYFVSGVTESGRRLGQTDLVALASPDGRFGTELNRARLLEGRLPQGLDEVAVTFLARDQLGLEVGSTVTLSLGGPVTPDPPPERFRVVGTVDIR
jgi:hypothetical protein